MSPKVSHTLGFIYYKKDLVSLAIRTFKRTAENDRGNALYQYHLGWPTPRRERHRMRSSRCLGTRGEVGLRGAQEARDLLRSWNFIDRRTRFHVAVAAMAFGLCYAA